MPPTPTFVTHVWSAVRLLVVLVLWLSLLWCIIMIIILDHFAFEGANYGLPHQGLSIGFLGIFSLQNPFVKVDLIITFGRFPAKDTISRHIDKTSILASSIFCANWSIMQPQILLSSSVHWV